MSRDIPVSAQSVEKMIQLQPQLHKLSWRFLLPCQASLFRRVCHVIVEFLGAITINDIVQIANDTPAGSDGFGERLRSSNPISGRPTGGASATSIWVLTVVRCLPI